MALPLWVKFLWQDVKEFSFKHVMHFKLSFLKNATFKKDVLKSQMYEQQKHVDVCYLSSQV